MNHQGTRSIPATLRTALLALTLAVSWVGLAPAPASAAVTFEARMLELVNQVRSANGVAPVQLAPAVASIAQDAPYQGCGFTVAGRSADMGARNYFSHTILNCGTQGVSDMLRASVGGFSGLGENIAWVSAMTDPVMAAERLHNDLMADATHRANILNPAFTHIGIGSWHTASGLSWSGGGTSLRNVYLTTEIFTSLPTTTTATGSRYHPLSPSRILDTRSGAGPLGPGATLNVQVAGQGGVPAAGVAAVVLNVTVTGPTAPSFLTVYPTGSAMPTASNLNYTAGQTVPNLVTAKLGAGGQLTLYNACGSTQVIADVAGWFDDGATTTGSRYHPLAPSRILDTRFAAGPVGPGATLNVQVAGQGGVPAAGVAAVVLNVTVTGPTATSFLTVYPAGQGMPNASNLNYIPGETVPNLVTAKVGAGGQLSLYNAFGSTQVIADVAGWFDDGTSSTGALYHPLAPSRLLDTRSGAGPVGPGATLNLQVAGQGGVPASGVAAVVLNVTVTGPTATSFLTVYPAGQGMPTASNLNYTAGETVPNLVTAKLGSGGQLALYNAAGSTQVIADVAGWFDAG